MTTRTVFAATIGTAALLAGSAPILGQMTHQMPHPGGGMAGGPEVTINDAGFTPPEMVVAPGQKVTWENIGVNPHTVTANDASFDSGTLNKGGMFELTAPAVSGTYAYHCTFHAFMQGNVVVSTLTLSGPKQVLAGKTATLRGTAPGMAPGTPVVVESLTGTTFTQIATTTIAADGTYRVTTPKLTKATEIRVRAGAETSPTLALPVAPKVAVKKTPKVKLSISVTVTPKAAGKAKLESLNTNTFKWKTVKQFRVLASGKATVKVPKAGNYRVTVLATKNLAQSTSPTVKFS